MLREPGYETLPEVRRVGEPEFRWDRRKQDLEDVFRSLEPGYEELPSQRADPQYSRVNKKRAAPAHPSPPRPRLYSGSEVGAFVIVVFICICRLITRP